MTKAAFASVVVLAVVALAGSNLLSQPTDKKAQRATDAALPDLGSATAEPRFDFDAQDVLDQGGRKGAAYPAGDVVSEEELLRSKLRKLVEQSSKSMSANELREAIGVMERCSVEPEFAPIIEQLQAILQKHAPSTPDQGHRPGYWDDPLLDASTPPVPWSEVQVRLKANLAIELLQTQDVLVLMAVQNALSQKTVPEKPAIPTHLDDKLDKLP